MVDELAAGLGRIPLAPVGASERVGELDLDAVEGGVALVFEHDPRGDVVLERDEAEQALVLLANGGPEAEIVVRALLLAVHEPVACLSRRPQTREPGTADLRVA